METFNWIDLLLQLPQKPSISDLYSVPIAWLGNEFLSKLITVDVRRRKDYGIFKLIVSNITLSV